MNRRAAKRRQEGVGYRWRPLAPVAVLPASRALIEKTMADYSCDEKRALVILREYQKTCRMFANDLYQVQVRQMEGGLFHLNIRRRDGAPIIRDWRHFQQIKNEILGPECEAIELYPAESRKVDTSNKYHLWGFADPEKRWTIGFDNRDVRYEDNSDPGMAQRPQSMRVEPSNAIDEAFEIRTLESRHPVEFLKSSLGADAMRWRELTAPNRRGA